MYVGCVQDVIQREVPRDFPKYPHYKSRLFQNAKTTLILELSQFPEGTHPGLRNQHKVAA